MSSFFKKNKYCIIENAISLEMANFIHDYICLKKKVAKKLFEYNYISLNETTWGTWLDPQVPNTYSHYSDLVMETLLEKVLPQMQKHTGLKLVSTYSYTRVYKKGDVLKRHKDRPSCEISTTMNLGGDKWPIYLSPNENVGFPNEQKGITTESKAKGIKVDLRPGDMLVYSGCELEHWRKKFTGNYCAQVFLHYNRKQSKNKNEFDGRPFLGLPSVFKRRK